jgi:hypothetical protein
LHIRRNYETIDATDAQKGVPAPSNHEIIAEKFIGKVPIPTSE